MIKEDIQKAKEPHRIWHRFSDWLTKTYGKDLHGDWQYLDEENKKYKYRSFDDLEFSRRIVGYEVMERVEKYCKRWCPEIKIVHVDDDVFAGSTILLIPHPAMGICVMFIPQCTSIQNRFFLYYGHYKRLTKALAEMEKTYEGSLGYEIYKENDQEKA